MTSLQKCCFVLFFFVSAYFLKAHVWVSDREVDPVLKAIKDGDVGTLRGLIKKADCNLLMPNKYGWIPLHEAAHYGQEHCVKALLRGNAKTSSSQLHTLKATRTQRDEITSSRTKRFSEQHKQDKKTSIHIKYMFCI